MPQVPASHLLGIRVETQSGVRLGIVKEYDIDVDQQTVTRYYVTARLPRPFASNPLIVSPAQVVAIEATRMVVVDALAPEGALAVAQNL